MSCHHGEGQILAVEDDRPTAELLTAAFEEVDPSLSLDVVENGSRGLAVLRGDDETIHRPTIVLLDLDLPDIDGFTVLARRSEDPELRQIPVIVFSGKDDPETVRDCYDRGANAVISKPDDWHGYVAVAELVVDHWFSMVELPSESTGTYKSATETE